MITTTMLSRLPFRAWTWYIRCLEIHPWKTQLISTGALLGAGDFIAQQYVEKVPLLSHDVVRTARMAMVGTVVIGPIFHVWYATLDRRFARKSPGNAIKKMTVDQSILAPVFLILFYGAVGIVERRTLREISDKIYAEFYPNMVVNYKVWPAIQFMNFYLFPAHLRVLVVNVASLFWNTYLAWTSHRDVECLEQNR